jgi:DNA repair exonuclease SbcCD ATPase subunit
MYLKSIKTKNYQNLGSQEFYFDKINLIKGQNGCGKSNLIGTIMFALFGYTRKYKLSEIKTIGIKEKECWAEIEIENNGINYFIRREIPTKIIIKQNGIDIDPQNKMTNDDKQEFIQKLFHTINWFKQFRLIDAYDKEETNFLEKSDITIKKILFAGHEDRLNKVRERLLQIKLEREKFSRDDTTLYTHFPSVKRLKMLKLGVAYIEDRLEAIDEAIEQLEEEHNNYLSKKSEKEGTKNYLSKLKQKLTSYSQCPVCQRKIDKLLKDKLIAEKQEQIQNLILEIIDLKEKVNKYSERITIQEEKKEELYGNREKLNELIIKLESRIHTKDYRYTKKDILIAKKAIDEINRISSYYLRQSVKVLEPIINQVLEPIRYTLSFEIDEKERFKIVLSDEKGKKWKYYQMSCGQKLLLQIAFKLALLMDRGEEGLLIADEGMGSLDSNNLYHIIEIIRNFPFQLILVLHRSPDFDNINVINLDKE